MTITILQTFFALDGFYSTWSKSHSGPDTNAIMKGVVQILKPHILLGDEYFDFMTLICESIQANDGNTEPCFRQHILDNVRVLQCNIDKESQDLRDEFRAHMTDAQRVVADSSKYGISSNTQSINIGDRLGGYMISEILKVDVPNFPHAGLIVLDKLIHIVKYLG